MSTKTLLVAMAICFFVVSFAMVCKYQPPIPAMMTIFLVICGISCLVIIAELPPKDSNELKIGMLVMLNPGCIGRIVTERTARRFDILTEEHGKHVGCPEEDVLRYREAWLATSDVKKETELG